MSLTLIKRLWQRDSTLVTVSPKVALGYILCAHSRYISRRFDRSVACDHEQRQTQRDISWGEMTGRLVVVDGDAE